MKLSFNWKYFITNHDEYDEEFVSPLFDMILQKSQKSLERRQQERERQENL